MANAATIAGLAFSNAFVGVNHALAHAVGARFGIAHGRANGIFLPHVLRYNAVAAAQVHAGARLPRLRRAARSTRRSAWVLGLGGRTAEERPRRAVRARRRAARRGRHAARRSRTRASTPAEYRAALPELAAAAFVDAERAHEPAHAAARPSSPSSSPPCARPPDGWRLRVELREDRVDERPRPRPRPPPTASCPASKRSPSTP